MYCKACGQQIANGAVFCQFCGARQGTDARQPAPAQPMPAAPSQAAQLFRCSVSGVPESGISGKAISLLGDREFGARLFWRILTLIGAVLLVIHTFGLYFGSVLKVVHHGLSMIFSLKSVISRIELSESVFTVFTLIFEIVCTLAVLGLLAFAVMKFLAHEIRGILQMLGLAFGAVAAGKIILVIWYFVLTSDIKGKSNYADYSMCFALIWSLLVCAGLAVLFIFVSREYAQYRETPAIPVPAGAPAAYQQPAAPQSPIPPVYQQPAAPQPPVQPYPQNPQNPQAPPYR